MPAWIRYLIGVALGVLLALVLSPLFPAPISTVLFWVGWVAAAICLVLAGTSFLGGARAVR